MTKKLVLIVTKDHDLYLNTRKIILDGLKKENFDIVFNWKTSRNDAADEIVGAECYNLVIAELHLPEDINSTIDEKADCGLKLVKEIQKFKIPTLLIAPAETKRLREKVEEIRFCRILSKGSKYKERLLKLSTMFLDQAGSNKVAKQTATVGEVDLLLDSEKDLWRYRITGGIDFKPREDKLVISADLLEDLANRTENIQELSRTWKTELEQIGKALGEEIVNKNTNFMRDLYELIGKISQMDKIRIRFQVDQKTHPILLEAIREKNQFLMLDSPVYRRIIVEKDSRLFTLNKPTHQRDPLNCLIILPDFTDSIGTEDKTGAGYKSEFPPLKATRKEAEWLQFILEKNRSKYNIGEVQLIIQNPKVGSYRNHVKKSLRENQWHIVHYAGHTAYRASKIDENEKRAFLVFPSSKKFEKGKPSPDLLDIREFGQWLRRSKTELVFLSGCQSSQKAFVYDLARNEIPAVIGFRWKVRDEPAKDCAEKFYRHLFEDGLTLEYAFLETRRDMHREHSDSRVWAALMLIMQDH